MWSLLTALEVIEVVNLRLIGQISQEMEVLPQRPEVPKLIIMIQNHVLNWNQLIAPVQILKMKTQNGVLELAGKCLSEFHGAWATLSSTGLNKDIKCMVIGC